MVPVSPDEAVVPGYYLVCYNLKKTGEVTSKAVVPGYYLVCYNPLLPSRHTLHAVVPGYYLVCYNIYRRSFRVFLL